MKIGIIGLGLIGGSLARSILKKTQHEVYGLDISEDTMLKGELLHSFTQRLTDENVKTIDILIISLYPRYIAEYIERFGRYLKKGAIVLDCAGDKRNVKQVFESAKVKYPHLSFIATHPMAGSEFSGIRYSTANMFDNASALFIPVKAELSELTLLKKLFLEIGFGEVIISNAETHDKVIAYTSQLAHLVSSSYVKSPTAQQHAGYSGGSFKDMTRVSKLNADMWAELMIDNKDNLIYELDTLINNLLDYKNALKNGDEKMLKNLLNEGTKIKTDLDNQKITKG